MRILRRHPLLGRLLLIFPSMGIIGFFMVVPMFLMVYVSFLERNSFGGVEWGQHSAQAYITFLFEENLDGSLAFNSDYLWIFMRSFWLSFSTMALCVLVGFPTALFIAMSDPKHRNLLIFFVTIPFWTNLLIRNYSWILLLRDHGVINSMLVSAGVIGEPLPLLYNDFAIAVGLTYSFLPFMVLPAYASLEKIDFRLIEAGYDLYADKWRVLRHIVLPLAKPGLIAGSILVFVPSLGAYVTPELLGGSKHLMIGNLIQMQFGASRNWPFGAALSFTLLAIVLLAMWLYLGRSAGKQGGGLAT